MKEFGKLDILVNNAGVMDDMSTVASTTVLQTRYKHRTSHYSSEPLEATCVQYKIHPDNFALHFLIVIYARHRNAFHSPEVFLLYSVCYLE